jgi:hypothetical protein
VRCGLIACSAISSRKVELLPTMEAEKPQIVEDPNLAAEQERAQRSLINNLQTQAQMDTANIMTRFGNSVALANAGMASAPTGPTATASLLARKSF